jgi:large conductance mechanosensitive channel
MSFIKEFKQFAVKGNVIDLAIAVVIGAAFGKIVSSLIDDVITPLLLKPALDAAHLKNLDQLTILGSVKYGNFLAAVINFIIIALVLFMIIKVINRTKKKEVPVETAPTLSTTDQLLMDIRDELKSKPSV